MTSSASLVNGRFRIVRPLGEGGMGSVHLAADLAEEGRPVALKRLVPTGSSGPDAGGFASEFEAMTRLRHPNVVEVYQLGVDRSTGERFLTLEYVEGVDLRSAAAGRPLDGKLDLLVQVCRGLGYIHARGIIHNDLKPQNIIVTAAEPPVCKLMDFGLASLLGEAESPRRLRGTLQYLAPELIHGGLPDRRSDIYSLGVLFYLVLAGRLPFDGEPSEILTRAVSQAPAPPSRLEPTLLPPLEALILEMMARDPASRPAGAEAIIGAVGRATGRQYEVDTPATLASCVRTGSLVGRDAEVEKLGLLLEEAHEGEGTGRGVLIVGEGGIGKSRLVRQLGFEAQARGGDVAVGQCYEGSSSAFHPWRLILRQLIPQACPDETLAPILSTRPETTAAGSEAADPEREQNRAIDAAVQALLATAGDRPVTICLEDLQWCDAPSLRLLEHLARNIGRGSRMLVAITCREEDTETPPLAALLPRLVRVHGWEQMRLERLDREEVGAMVAGMFGLSSPPESLMERLAGETEGNPLFVQAAVEALLSDAPAALPAEDRMADADALAEIPFPRSIGDAISRRLARLDPPATDVLETLAVAERPIEAGLLHDVLEGVNPTAVGAAVEGLARRRLIVRVVDPDGVIRVRIDHVRIRSHVYETMDWQRRSELHGRFGRQLERRGEAGLEELAHHFVNSPDLEQALSYAERAGLRAMEQFDAQSALRFLERALELVPPTDAGRRLRIQLAFGDACRQARDHDRAVEAYQRVVQGARAAGTKKIAWTASTKMIHVQFLAGQVEEARRAAERLTGMLRAEGEARHLASCLTTLASIAAGEGRMDDARALNEEALALRREAEDRGGSASNLNNLGLIELIREPSARGLALLAESMEIRKEMGDIQRGAEALINIGAWHRRGGDLRAAIARTEEVLDLARRHRDRWMLAEAQVNLAAAYREMGRPDRALAASRDAVRNARAIGDAALRCEALDQQGMVELDLGRLDAAAAAHEEAAALARDEGLAVQEAYALASLALDRLAGRRAGAGEVASAKEALRRASKLAGGSASPRLQARLHEAAAWMHLVGGEIREALESARCAIESARSGGLAPEQAAAEILAGGCLLAEEGSLDLEEASAAAARALALARSGGAPESEWRAYLLVARTEKHAGRRAEEREALDRAARLVERTAEAIADGPIRLAYLSEPSRADLLRGAEAARQTRARLSGAHVAPSAEGALAAIYQVAGIISSMSDLDAMLRHVLDVALGLVGAERGLVVLRDETTGDQQVRTARDLEDETVSDALEYSRSVVKEATEGRVIIALDAPHDDRFRNYKSVSLYDIKSLMCVPMRTGDRIIGSVYVDSRARGVPFTEQDVKFLEALATLAAGAVEQARLHERLSRENVYLRREAGERYRYHNIIGKNVKMQAVYDLLDKVAASILSVLIQGESGTGKELVARALHYSGPRRARRFYSENVAAIPDTLLESEMFGHVRGAFTGADRDRKGLFELADGGTLFLDEIGDMSLPMQSKLLRALQEGEIRPVGGKETKKVDVRVISATNKDLDRLMKEGRFREDLYWRLNVVRIPLPPLRERKEDIPLLVDHFLKKIARDAGGAPRKVEVGALQLLLRYSWPGNVRELENEIQRLAVMCPGEVITQRNITESGELYEKITRLEEKDAFTPLEEMERRQIEKALAEAAGNRARAAELLGISRATIFRKLKKFGISH